MLLVGLALGLLDKASADDNMALLDKEVLAAVLSGASATPEEQAALRDTNLQLMRGSGAAGAPTDCETSPWSGFTPCTQSCGGGLQARARMVLAQPTHGGLACPTLMETRECKVVDCARTVPAQPTVVGSEARSAGDIGVPLPDIAIVENREGVQLGSYPYLLGGGSTNRQPSVEACEQQCLSHPDCWYGTFVTEATELVTSTHSWGSNARHASTTTAAPTTAPTMAPTAAACTCDPELHASAFTTCHRDPFNGHIRVVHLAPRFHTSVLKGGVQHHCKMLALGCRCCDCMPRKQFKNIKSVGFGVHTATSPFLESGEQNIQPSQFKCEEQCSTDVRCKVGTFISGGPTAGQCWLSANAEHASSCNDPCQSFEKVDAQHAHHDANNLPATVHERCPEGERYICFAPTRCRCFPQLIGR